MDLTLESAQRTVDIIKKAGGTAIGFASNVLSEKSVRAVSKEIFEQWGRVDILLNAAGGNMPGATIVSQGTHAERLHVVYSGKVALMSRRGGSLQPGSPTAVCVGGLGAHGQDSSAGG